MRWESHHQEITKRISHIPGGTTIVDKLVEFLDIQTGQELLDLDPGSGAVAAAIASEYDVKITALEPDVREENATERIAGELHVKDRIKVIPAAPAAIPLPSEQFHRAYHLADPFPLPSAPGVISEVHRMIAPGGLLGLAGPASINNKTPAYMLSALSDYEGVTFRTPAWTAMTFAQYGFHIVRAEFIASSYDLWKEWLENNPHVPETLRSAVVEDQGRWLMLGIALLRKPPKPHWAV
jgi:ubiquinone/menaquinone biosynthesis C-methylase UbiE